ADNSTGRRERGHKRGLFPSQGGARRPAAVRATLGIIGAEKARPTRVAEAVMVPLLGAAVTMSERLAPGPGGSHGRRRNGANAGGESPVLAPFGLAGRDEMRGKTA